MFEPRSRKYVFLGYKLGIKGYVWLDTKNREIFTNQNVIFYENIFSYKNSNDTFNINQNYDTQNIIDFLLEFLVNENINFVGIDKRLNDSENRIFSVNENQDNNNKRDIRNNEETHNQESEVQEASHERTTNTDLRKSTKQDTFIPKRLSSSG